ncbi:MAG: Gfo/Idh/MocA family oxidoreductase [Hyphomicrobiales bacterium]|nr:Gfo/Idh/MocA family oxidoreductase [Hyphomicrobiales bacterium]
MGQALGVGIIGGGLATQAIQLPTLARLADAFRVTRVMDVDASVAASVARRCGAEPAGSVEEVCRDPRVDAVAVCSPHGFHAAQAIAACRAGKRLVFIEKPLATTRAEAREIVNAAREAGTRIVVGAMHVFDPAYRAARKAWAETGDEARHVHSSIYLPSNDHFIDQATDRLSRQAGGPQPLPEFNDPSVQAAALRGAILGLSIHDLPLIRSFAPAIDAVVSARFIPPFGYDLAFTGEGRSVRLFALMPGSWAPHWRLRAIGRTHELSASFPPSYVLAGSSSCALRAPDRTVAFEQSESGYESMWRHAYEVATGAEQPVAELEDLLADFDYALDLVDRVDALLGVKS